MSGQERPILGPADWPEATKRSPSIKERGKKILLLQVSILLVDNGRHLSIQVCLTDFGSFCM